MKEFKKSTYVISAEKVVSRTEVYNYLEDCHYVTTEEKCIVLTGTADEQWPITEAKLRETYTFKDGSEIRVIPSGKFEIIPAPDAKTIFAERTTEKVVVETAWGEKLKANRDGVPHGEGDFIVCGNKDGAPDPDDRWVINGLIFEKTYEPV